MANNPGKFVFEQNITNKMGTHARFIKKEGEKNVHFDAECPFDPLFLFNMNEKCVPPGWPIYDDKGGVKKAGDPPKAVSPPTKNIPFRPSGIDSEYFLPGGPFTY